MARRLSEKDFPDVTVFYRTLAFMWLRYEQGCYMITFERHPYSDRDDVRDKPDVLGLTKRRRLIEVELKVSLVDMKKDLQKPHRLGIVNDIGRQFPSSPSHLYYMVPAHLAGDALEILPPYTGILSPHPFLRDAYSGFPAVAVHRKSTPLHDSKVSTRVIADMARDLSGTMASLLTEMTYILRDHPEYIHNGRLDFDLNRIHAAAELPKPFTVTPPAAILDDGSRSGKQMSKSEVARVWKERKAILTQPDRGTRVPR
jgi:hypothetical protein